MRKKLSRKAAWSLTMTASLILALVFTGVGLQMVKRISKEISYNYDKGVCKQSVIVDSRYRLPYVQGEEFDLMCPTRYVTISPTKIRFEHTGGELERDIKCGRLDNDKSARCFFEVVNPYIADMIFDCWDQFAAGMLPVFDKYEEERQCLICARIEFTEDVISALGSKYGYSGYDPGTSLEDYMANHKPRTVMSKKEAEEHSINYISFTLDPLDAFGRDPYEYKPEEPMAVVFTALNEHQAKVLVGGAWEGFKKYVLRDDRQQDKQADEFVNKLDFIPYSSVKHECEVLR
jgi:hypothetical protein